MHMYTDMRAHTRTLVPGSRLEDGRHEGAVLQLQVRLHIRAVGTHPYVCGCKCKSGRLCVVPKRGEWSVTTHGGSCVRVA